MPEILFGPHTKEEQTKSLADFLPNGKVFGGKLQDGTTLNRLLLGLGVEIFRAENKMNELGVEHDIAETTLLIEEWESALGIPDDCFDQDGTLEERRNQVITKLTALGISTREGFEALAAQFGFVVRVGSGAEFGIFPLPFPFIFFKYPIDARFTMVVDFDKDQFPNVFALDFPIEFSSSIVNVVICLFEKLKPANVCLLFRFLPDIGNLTWNDINLIWENVFDKWEDI